MMWRWWWLMVVALVSVGAAHADDDSCLVLDGNIALEQALKFNAADRRETDRGLEDDPGNLELHHRVVADFATGKRKRTAGVIRSILVLVHHCPATELVGHRNVLAVQRPAIARAWQRSVRLHPSYLAISHFYGYRMRGKAPIIRARDHADVTVDQLQSLLDAHEQLARSFGKSDASVRAIARRAHRTGEKLLERSVAARVARAKMSPLSQVEPEPIPVTLIEKVSRAALASGNLRRSEELAALILILWTESGGIGARKINGTLAILNEIALAKGNLSLSRALEYVYSERNDPWR
ncbi:MAG: hypothetical protein KJO07_11370 [Deltaproteobacteria bacterium]|nr:hypothetical protein [Deltaproteobacteria bacterium]